MTSISPAHVSPSVSPNCAFPAAAVLRAARVLPKRYSGAMAFFDLGLVSRLLGRGLSRGADFSEIFVQRRQLVALELEDGHIKSVRSAIEHGVGIRVVKGLVTAYAHSDDLSDRALLDCAEAASFVDGREDAEVQALARPLGMRGRPHHADAKALFGDDLEARKTLLSRVDVSARLSHAAVERVHATYVDSDEEILIANSEGLVVNDRRALCRMSVDVIAKDPRGERTSGNAGGGSRLGRSHFETVQTPEHMAEEAVRMAVAQFGARQAPVGEQTVVVGPASSGVLLHEAVGHGLEADFIRKRSSIFTGRLGQRVASELCTIVDDGTLAHQRGSLNVDDEGQATQRTVLVERGILRAYMSDGLNARALSVERTGNGRRESYKNAPLPRMTNTFLAAGDDDPADIIASVKRGIYCRRFGGGQVNIGNGNFVFEVKEGYLIEDGHLTAPIKGATLTGNGPDVLTKVARVGHDSQLDGGSYTCGKDGQSVPVCVGLPTIRIDGITVGGGA